VPISTWGAAPPTRWRRRRPVSVFVSPTCAALQTLGLDPDRLWTFAEARAAVAGRELDQQQQFALLALRRLLP
jgi:hypothetical protein